MAHWFTADYGCIYFIGQSCRGIYRRNIQILPVVRVGAVMNGKNTCCEGTPIVQDSSGDKICTGCGTIIDNYPREEKDD